MPTTPVISVIVPVYKAERYLNECIDSILAQTFSNFELILVDDGSPDRSGEICDQYAAKDKRIRVIHKPNGGVSSARNAGLDIARGEWITFVDADDMIAPDMLEKLFNKAEQENADIVTCDFKFLYPDGHTKIEHAYYWHDNSEQSLAEYMLTTWTVTWGCVINRAIIKANNIFFDVQLSINEDFIFIIRCILHASKIATIQVPLYFYRQQHESACHTFTTRKLQDQLDSLDLIESDFKNARVGKEIYKPLYYRRLLNIRFMLLDTSLHNKYIRLNNQNTINHIVSCPFYNTKQKIIAWCLTHHLRMVSYAIAKFRKLCGR